MSSRRQNGMNHLLRILRLVDGSLVPVIPRGHRRIADRDDGLGVEAVIGLGDFVFLRLGLIDVAERALMHEGEMRIVEGVLHQPQRRACSTCRRTDGSGDTPASSSCGNVGNIAQGLVERDPDIAVAGLGAERSRARRAPAARTETAGSSPACRRGHIPSRDSRRRCCRRCTSPSTVSRCGGSSDPPAPPARPSRRGTARRARPAAERLRTIGEFVHAARRRTRNRGAPFVACSAWVGSSEGSSLPVTGRLCVGE